MLSVSGGMVLFTTVVSAQAERINVVTMYVPETSFFIEAVDVVQGGKAFSKNIKSGRI